MINDLAESVETVGNNLLALSADAGNAGLRALESEWGVFNIRRFGAKIDGVSDDSAAIQAAVSAAQQIGTEGGGGTVFLPPGQIKVNSPVELWGNDITVAGCGAYASVLRSDSSDILHIGPSDGKSKMGRGTLRDFGLRSTLGGGHCMQIGSVQSTEEHGMYLGVIERLMLINDNADKHAILCDKGILLDSSLRNLDIRHRQDSLVPAVRLTGTGGINTNNFSRWRMTQCGKYQIELVCVADGTYNYGNVFEGINFEISPNGCIYLDGCFAGTVKDCGLYDTTGSITADCFYLGRGNSGSGTFSNGNNFQSNYSASPAEFGDNAFVAIESGNHANSVQLCQGLSYRPAPISVGDTRAQIVRGSYCDLVGAENAHVIDLQQNN